MAKRRLVFNDFSLVDWNKKEILERLARMRKMLSDLDLWDKPIVDWTDDDLKRVEDY